MSSPYRTLLCLLAALPVLLSCTTAPVAQPPATATPQATVTSAAEQPSRAYLAQLPPLIDRERFFDDPEIAGAQVSPDGRFISFRKPYKGVMNIWVKGIAEPWSAARPITADLKRPVIGYFWSEDGRYILHVQDKGGNENFHVYVVDPASPPDPATGVPTARDLTPIENARALIYAVPERTPNQIIIGLNDRNPSVYDVYRLDLTTGQRTLLIRNEQNVASWVTDREGNVRMAYRQTPAGDAEFLRVVDGRLGEPVFTCSYEESCFPLRFDGRGARLFIVSNKGTEVDRTRLMLLNPDTGMVELIDSDPQNEVDFGSTIFSDRTEELVGTTYNGDKLRVYMRDPQYRSDYEFLQTKLRDGEIRLLSSTNDDRLMLVSVSGDTNPGTIYLFDRGKRSVEKLYDVRPDLPKESLAPMRPVRYRSRDGRMIPAYLTTPRNVEARHLPTIINPHGGPWARDFWGYNSFAQFLANRGYVVLQLNFRGSSGYGKNFLNAGNLQWGTGSMQHDITDGVKWLIEQGIADPDRIGIMGGSYGGYATLAGITFTPDLYAAAVAIVGPSNLSTLIRSFPPYWRPTMTGTWFKRVGDPDKPDDAERLRGQSPVFFADKIGTPLLLIHGANDPRVKKEESDQIVVALRDLGSDVEYLVISDEGHGFAGRENRLAYVAATERFFAKHLGGRFQESIRPEIQQKLAEITVDVSKVQRPQLTESGAFKTSPQ